MKNSRGFTLIEIMIVLVIFVTISFLGTSLITNTFRSKARELSWRMASTVKYLFNSAITENKTVRLVLDFENNSYWAEGTTDKFLLESSEEIEKRQKLKEEKAEKGTDEEKAEKTADETNVERTTAENGTEGAEEEKPASAIEPIEPSFGAIETPLMSTKQLPSGIFIKDVYTSHDKEPVTAGRAYIYFFQNGSAEAAIINFRDETDEKQISVKIDPFTGGTSVEPEYRKLEEVAK